MIMCDKCERFAHPGWKEYYLRDIGVDKHYRYCAECNHVIVQKRSVPWFNSFIFIGLLFLLCDIVKTTGSIPNYCVDIIFILLLLLSTLGESCLNWKRKQYDIVHIHNASAFFEDNAK